MDPETEPSEITTELRSINQECLSMTQVENDERGERKDVRKQGWAHRQRERVAQKKARDYSPPFCT